ncbi:HAD family hydrolase [Clostridium sp. NSJ-145]|uniref:HAD-IIB family hydrolase n=1 Tax=Clostridium sp. NSJ-145 TaxID=2897777 RepID=UPI001E585765|nr:HAD-IIB family hydrolase [Clostridium sp. NSJ-145]MCD2502256.1 HAD family hydrolase [Clostridium sp. NSJ-145]
MRKMLASDLDGTLLFKGKVSDENKKALKKFKTNGGIFSLSTGRAYNEIENIIKEMDIRPDYFILNNGALILDDKAEIIHKSDLDYKATKEILAYIKKYTDMVSIQTGFKSYAIVSKLTKLKIKIRMIIKNLVYGLNYKDERVYVKNLDEIENVKNETFTLMAANFNKYPVEEIQKVADYINNNYGDYVECYRNTIFLDIVPKGCSKGHGVKCVSEIVDLHMDNVYTIGDSWNDDSMFQVTKNSFTFTYAEEGLQKKTTHVVETVAQCIDKYILI